MSRIYTNNAVHTALTAPVDAVATTIPVGSTAGWPDPGVGQEAVAALSFGDQTAVEIVTYTGLTATSLTGVTRGVDGTTAKSHATGAAVWHVVSAADIEAMVRLDSGAYVAPGDDAATLGSGAATDGHVLTADGLGGAMFEAATGGGGGVVTYAPASQSGTNYGIPSWLPSSRSNAEAFGADDGRIIFILFRVLSPITLNTITSRRGSNTAPAEATMRAGIWACDATGQPAGAPVWEVSAAATGNGVTTWSSLALSLGAGWHAMGVQFTDPTTFVCPSWMSPVTLRAGEVVVSEWRTGGGDLPLAYGGLPSSPGCVVGATGGISTGTYSWPFYMNWSEA